MWRTVESGSQARAPHGYGIRAQIDPGASADWARAELIEYLSGALGTSLDGLDRHEPASAAATSGKRAGGSA